jgi:AraC family transcriptional activator of pobA
MPVPVFFLYGEPRQEVGPRFLHLEPLADRSAPSDWNIRAHAHADLHHIFFITRGNGRITADGNVLSFVAPCLLIVPAAVVHSIVYEPETTGFVLTIADHYLRDLTSREPDFTHIFAAPSCLELDDATPMKHRLARLEEELIWDAPGSRAAIESDLLGILVEVLRLSHAVLNDRQIAGRAAQLVARFRVQIEAMYRANGTLQDYAKTLRVTPAQLRRACLQITRQPPMALVHERVFHEAQRVLYYTGMTVTEAAQYLGFTDSAYFSRFFSKHAGCSPRKFRGR